jgi:hypothetical protein
MKKVCGTCNLGVDHKAGNSSIEVLCAFANEWRLDRIEGCTKWQERTEGLSKKDRIDLANGLKGEKDTERRHHELIKDSEATRKNQLLLLILGALLGVIGTLLSQYIWSLWMK